MKLKKNLALYVIWATCVSRSLSGWGSSKGLGGSFSMVSWQHFMVRGPIPVPCCPWRLGLSHYKGPLNWFPERCCRMDGLDPAASPSLRHTTWEWTCATVILRLWCANLNHMLTAGHANLDCMLTAGHANLNRLWPKFRRGLLVIPKERSLTWAFSKCIRQIQIDLPHDL